ncbi:LysM peptidoglycan-binding domain-containing protein [Olsenella sp. HMSC062G07]|uniref:LysM peptidoglycan-binding domain-containing protein n=1 Tax=Olsenella sp. HMSC062G07 TaxID=1739330 RepID=UPI0008A59AD7|nr:LysM peptidoglycan-binding domain-containing protein [Olsenella sp. HMSC062G07]OFK24667.1 hypothetical protein HMPREF2826_07165 [Olsenella sp. HMSC062G07]
MPTAIAAIALPSAALDAWAPEDEERPLFTLITGGRSCADVPAMRRLRHARVPLRLTAAGVVLALAALVAVGLLLSGAQRRAAALLEAAPTQVVVVHQGDSVWDIAQRSRLDGVSTQDVASWIGVQNDLDGARVRPGDRLVVPAS